MTCQKQFSITIESSGDCPDWSTELFWDVPIIFTAGAAAASSFPSGAVSDIQLMSILCPPVNPNSAQVNAQGNLPYNGSGCNIQLRFDIQNVGGAIGGGVWSFQSDNGVFLGSGDWGTMGTGIQTLPFAIPDTLGVPDTYRFNCSMSKVWDTAPGQMQVQIIFSNV